MKSRSHRRSVGFAWGIHPDRAAGGDRDHCRVDRALAAGGSKRSRVRASGSVREQPQTDRYRPVQLPRLSGHLAHGDGTVWRLGQQLRLLALRAFAVHGDSPLRGARAHLQRHQLRVRRQCRLAPERIVPGPGAGDGSPDPDQHLHLSVRGLADDLPVPEFPHVPDVVRVGSRLQGHRSLVVLLPEADSARRRLRLQLRLTAQRHHRRHQQYALRRRGEPVQE